MIVSAQQFAVQGAALAQQRADSAHADLISAARMAREEHGLRDQAQVMQAMQERLKTEQIMGITTRLVQRALAQAQAMQRAGANGVLAPLT